MRTKNIYLWVLLICFAACRGYKNNNTLIDSKISDTRFKQIFAKIHCSTDSVQIVVDSLEKNCKSFVDVFAINTLDGMLKSKKPDAKQLLSCICKSNDSLLFVNKEIITQRPFLYVNYLFVKINYYIISDSINEAKNLLLHAEQFSLKNDSVELYMIYDKYAQFYYERREQKNAAKYLKMKFLVKKNKTINDSIGHCYKLGIVYDRMVNEYPEIYDSTGIKKMKITVEREIDSAGEKIMDSASLYINMGLQLSKMFPNNGYEILLLGANAGLFSKLKMYNKAYKMYDTIYKHKDKINNLSATDVFNMAIAAENVNHHKESALLYEKAINISIKNKDKNHLSDCYKNAARFYYNELHDYKKAAWYFMNYNKIYTIQFNTNKEAEIAKIEKQFNLKLKDEEIKAAKNTLNLQKWIFFGLFLGLVVSAILFYLSSSKKKLQRQIEKNNIEQQLLRSQMDPHFIFNALSSMQTLIVKGDNILASTYLSKFAKLLRLMLENSTEPLVPLSAELEALEHYIQLQQMRYGHSFFYNLQIVDGIGNYLIAPMLLQPFVENAIEHGLHLCDEGGMLSINISKDTIASNSLLCSIADNGVGIGQNSENVIQKKSLSTGIVMKRLKLLSKQLHSKASITVQQNNGTEILLLIPFQNNM